MVQMMKSASAMAARRSVVAVTCAGRLFSRDVALAELVDHVEVVLGDVGKAKVRVLQFGDAEDILHEAAGEADGTGSDHGDFNGHRRAESWGLMFLLCRQYCTYASLSIVALLSL